MEAAVFLRPAPSRAFQLVVHSTNMYKGPTTIQELVGGCGESQNGQDIRLPCRSVRAFARISKCRTDEPEVGFLISKAVFFQYFVPHEQVTMQKGEIRPNTGNHSAWAALMEGTVSWAVKRGGAHSQPSGGAAVASRPGRPL